MTKRITFFSLLIAILTLFSGCASTGPQIVVSDANAKPIDLNLLNCKRPFILTQDCSNWSGPTKSIEIDGNKFKISGTEDGTLTMMWNSIYYPNAEKNNRNYELMKRELQNRGFEIVSVIPLLNSKRIQGYAILTKEPSYQVWDAFSVKKK